MTPDENLLCSTQRLKPRHKVFILGNLGLKLNEGIIHIFFFFYFNSLCSEMRIKVFIVFPKRNLLIAKKRYNLNVQHLEE